MMETRYDKIIDITVVIPAHAEGTLARHTMNSVFRAKAYAEENGLRIQVLVVMDKADKKTRDFFASYPDELIDVETVAFGDLGFTRNHGVSRAGGRYVAFLDADNLCCQNWLVAAVRHLKDRSKPLIVHPEYLVAFEAENTIWRQISSDAPRFNAANLIEYNYWDATLVAEKQLLLRFPYNATTSTKGFGFEDWHFNCETLAAGIPHHVVPETVLFLRKKRTGSLLAQTRYSFRTIWPSALFEPDRFETIARIA